jgi:hypothetical protein
LPLKKGLPVSDISQWYSGEVKGDLAFKFGPSIWLGNAELGLCWQTESDQNWHNADKNKVIEILPRGQTTLFKLHFVDVSTQLKAGQSLHYKFALLATPVKSLLRDGWALRVARSEPYGADFDLPGRQIKGEPALKYYKEIGVRNLFINVNDIWPWPMPVHQTFIDAYHKMVAAAHQYGMKLYPYMIHRRFPVNVPEFDTYGLSMMCRPATQYVQATNPPGSPRPGPLSVAYGADSQGAFLFCPESPELQDAYIHSLAEHVKTFGDDGVYLDGTVHIGPCENMEHGCGYKDADGTIHPTYPTFGVHEFMKRIYTVIKRNNPDSVIDAHCSWSYNPAGLAFADILWNGEQWHQYARTGAPGGYISGVLSLSQFRTEFMGTQLGVAAEMLTYRLGDPMKCAAISLLHDISPRFITTGFDPLTQKGDSYNTLIPRIWKMREAFDAEHAEKMFYWNNQAYVTVSPEKCYATLLRNPKTGLLVFVSNLSRDKREVAVHLNLKKLGLAGQNLKALEPLTNTTLEMTPDGQFSVPLDSEGWAYIWLQP